VAFDRILKQLNVIAIVGLSKDSKKDSNCVASYLKREGFIVVPINPSTREVLGEKCYPSLTAVSEDLKRRIEIVNIFRPSNEISSIVNEAIEIRKKYGNISVIWMQLGIIDFQSAAKAESVGMKVVMDRCILIEHQRLTRSCS